MSRFCLALCLAAACGRRDSARQAPSSVATADTGAKIDSILPMAESLRRFRAGLSEPERLEGGAISREALARDFLSAVASQDTVALAGLRVSRAEFAWLVFPQHIYSQPPHELDPAIFWLQLSAEGDKGLQRTLQRFGAHTLGFRGLQCQRDTVQVRPGPATIWSSCKVRYRDGTKVETRRLFGSIVERDGRVKLLSLANDL